jgi:hypothetical protein
MANKKTKSINDLIFHQRALEQLELIGLDTQNNLFDNVNDYDASFKLKKLNIDYNGYSMNLEKFYSFIREQTLLQEVLTYTASNKTF